MKRLLFPLCLLTGLLWPVLMAQQSNQNPLQLQVDSLIAQKRYADAIPGIENIIADRRSAGDWTLMQSYTIKLAEALTSLEDYKQVQEVLRKGILDLETADNGETILNAKLWLWRGLNNLRLGYYNDAIDAYQTAINIYEKNKFNGRDLAFCYKNAAQIFIRRNSYEQADKLLEAALRSDTSGRYHLSIYGQLANNAYWRGDLPRALSYFHTGQSLPPNDAPALASLRSAGALILITQGQNIEARRLVNDALAYYKVNSKDCEQRIRCLTTLADIATLQNKPREAEQYYRDAEAEGFAYFKGKSREMAKLYVETGLFYEKTNRPDRALEFYQKALIQAFPRFNSLNINDNPAVEEAWLESQAMRAAAAKAMLLSKKTDVALRLNAAHCFDLSFAVAAQLRRTYGNDVDKFALAANNRDNYTAAALNLWQLWRETNAPAVLARLFAFFEQTKAQALGDALQQQRALALSGIPDSMLERENNLRLEAAIAAKDLKEKELDGDSLATIRLKDRAFRQSKAYDDFLEGLKKQYPQFDQFSRAGLSADLPAIQASLPDTAALLSWFDAGDRYLCLVVQRTALSAFEVGRDSLLDGALSRFLGILADKNGQQTDPAAYFSNAHLLYQKLLPATALPASRLLIIIPAGRLCYLPFEALLTAPYTGGFASAPYLLLSKTVCYAWSATLLTLSNSGKLPENGLLQVAPFARSARDGLAPLPESRRDAPESVGATVLDGEAATVGEFLKKAPRYSALHLSTHADAGGRSVPGIELYDRRFTLPEIYAQRLHASLVSLSACETGTGRFAEGEGVLSLARAFAYAGAQSLLASHWSVNERSTAELFSVFYQNLDKGLPKAEALRQAKLSYLASSEMDARKAPFHWAAFTLTGADGPVDLGHGNWIQWTFLVIGILLFLLLLWRWRKKG